jgi:hypothetical protein
LFHVYVFYPPCYCNRQGDDDEIQIFMPGAAKSTAAHQCSNDIAASVGDTCNDDIAAVENNRLDTAEQSITEQSITEQSITEQSITEQSITEPANSTLMASTLPADCSSSILPDPPSPQADLSLSADVTLTSGSFPSGLGAEQLLDVSDDEFHNAVEGEPVCHYVSFKRCL